MRKMPVLYKIQFYFFPKPIDAVLHSPTPSIVSIAELSNDEEESAILEINDVQGIIDLIFLLNSPTSFNPSNIF